MEDEDEDGLDCSWTDSTKKKNFVVFVSQEIGDSNLFLLKYHFIDSFYQHPSWNLFIFPFIFYALSFDYFENVIAIVYSAIISSVNSYHHKNWNVLVNWNHTFKMTMDIG